VIVVDWEKGASFYTFYLQAVINVKIVGKKVSEFLKAAKINPLCVHCIGHSLGAHVN
jgi:hypothetical protein